MGVSRSLPPVMDIIKTVNVVGWFVFILGIAMAIRN